jgi:signal transduction histidine kinase
MKKLIIFLFLNSLYSQTKKSIDSLNTISFDIRQEKASMLEDDYLMNAKNAKKIKYKLGEAESYSNLSLVYYYQGKYEKDVYYSLQAIALYEAIDNKEKLALEYGELGYRMKKRNMQKALFYMQKGKNIAEKNRFQKPLLSIYNNYGYLKELQKEMDSALYFYNKCLKIKEKIKDSVGIPYSLNNIAMIYMQQNKFSKAQELLTKSLKIRTELKDQTGIAENNFYFGDLSFNQKKYSEAINYYEKTLETAKKTNYLDLIQNCYQAISKSNDLLGNDKEALVNFKNFILYKDSILNKETNSKIAELDIKFETTKKEKQIIQQQAEVKKRNLYLVGLSGLILLLGIIAYLINRQQKQKLAQQEQEYQLKNAISQIETQNKLQEQRLSISRDLHDNIGAQLTFIISSVDNVKYAFDITNEKLDQKLTNISSFAKETILELRDTIWAMNHNEISYEDLEIRINNYIEKAKQSKDQISFSFAIEDVLKTKRLTSVEGMNIYRTIQEAINNAIKYANASIISVNVKEQDGQTKITISDNGSGFDTETTESGNGLQNMKKRIEEIGGKFVLSSSIEGTKIEVLV